MLKYLEEQIAWRNERIAVYTKRILDLESIDIPSSLALDNNDMKHLIKQQQGFIEHNKNIIATYEEAVKDNTFQGIAHSIKDNSNLKDVHRYLLFEAYSELKKFKKLKLDNSHTTDNTTTLKNAYETISPYLQTPTSYSIPNPPIIIVKELYERLRVLDYSKKEANEVVGLLSSLDQERSGKPRGAKDPIIKYVDPITGETMHESHFVLVQSIE